MKRIVLTAPGTLELREAPAPRPAAGEALVRIRAVGVCGSDLHMFKEGAIGGITIADAGGPFVPGHECMGVVEGVADGADEALLGRRVFVEPAINCGRCEWCLGGRPNVCPFHSFLGLPPRGGCLSEYLTHPARLLEPLPDSVSDDAAVLLEPLAVALHTMDRLGVGACRSAVVLGAGPIGLMHVLLLGLVEANPLIVSEPLDYRLMAAMGSRGGGRFLGAGPENVVDVAAAETGGHGTDFVVECAGQPETFRQMVQCARPGGKVAVVGIPAEDVLSFPHSVARRKGLDILMIRRANRTFHRALALATEMCPKEGCFDLLGSRATHHWPLEQTQEAFETAAAYRDGVIKAIVNPWGEHA